MAIKRSMGRITAAVTEQTGTPQAIAPGGLPYYELASCVFRFIGLVQFRNITTSGIGFVEQIVDLSRTMPSALPFSRQPDTNFQVAWQTNLLHQLKATDLNKHLGSIVIPPTISGLGNSATLALEFTDTQSRILQLDTIVFHDGSGRTVKPNPTAMRGLKRQARLINKFRDNGRAAAGLRRTKVSNSLASLTPKKGVLVVTGYTVVPFDMQNPPKSSPLVIRDLPPTALLIRVLQVKNPTTFRRAMTTYFKELATLQFPASLKKFDRLEQTCLKQIKERYAIIDLSKETNLRIE